MSEQEEQEEEEEKKQWFGERTRKKGRKELDLEPDWGSKKTKKIK